MEQSVIERPEFKSQTPTPKKRGGYLLAIVLGVVLAVAAVAGVMVRLGERGALAKETEELAVPSVVVVHPKAEPPKQDLVLPSSLQAFTESPIYARTNGYLSRWYKDMVPTSTMPLANLFWEPKGQPAYWKHNGFPIKK